MEHSSAIQLQQGEYISSYDVGALFTSVPVDPAITIIKTNHSMTHSYTTGPPCQSNTLLHCWSFALKFQGKYYKQVYCAAIGCPISPLVANLFMEEFESKVISTVPNPPRLWLRYVDDTFVIQQAKHSQQFLQHINFIVPSIQFTTEVPNSNGSILFLDAIVFPGISNTLLTSLYRIPLHKGPGQFVPAKNYFGRRRNILGKFFIGCILWSYHFT